MVMANLCTGDNKLDFGRVWANKFCTVSAIYLRGGCDTARKQEGHTQPNSTLDVLSFLSKVLGGLGGVAMSDEQTIMCVCRISRMDAHYLINFAKFVLAAEDKRREADHKFMMEKRKLDIEEEERRGEIMIKKQKLELEVMKIQKAISSGRMPMTVGSILDSPLPALKFASVPRTSSTVASFPTTPLQVCRWEGFENLVQSHRANISPELLECTADPMERSSEVGHVQTCNDELDVVFHMQKTVCQQRHVHQ